MLNVKIQQRGLQDILDKVHRLENGLPKLLQEVCEQLMEYGFAVARAGFISAAYPGTNDVVVFAPEWEDDKLVLRAEGQAVAFIEFGTGKKYEDYPTDIPGDSADPYSDLGLSERGQYGHKRGSNPKGWVYVGDPGKGGLGVPLESKPGRVWTMGNPPARAMYSAAVAVADRDLALQIAREVFSKW